MFFKCARSISKATVNQQGSDIIVKSIDQSLNSCEFMVQSRVQSTVQSSPESRYCRDSFCIVVSTLYSIVTVIIYLPIVSRNVKVAAEVAPP